MAQLTLWQKLKFVEELMTQINDLQTQADELQKNFEDSKAQREQVLVEFEDKITADLKKQKKRENFLNELIIRQNQEKEVYNQIIVQINSAIDSRLSDPEEFSKFNIDPNNPKEIELIKKTLRQKLLTKV